MGYLRMAAVGLLAAVATGCGPGAPHAWVNVPGDEVRAGGDWEAVDVRRFATVTLARGKDSEEAYRDAVGRLRDVPVVELTGEEVRPLLPPVREKGDDCGELAAVRTGEKVYLVRGVAYGGYPAWVRVWWSESRRALWVHEGTYNGEMLLPAGRQEAVPVVVAPAGGAVPRMVYVTCLAGGDMAVRPIGGPTTVAGRASSPRR